MNVEHRLYQAGITYDYFYECPDGGYQIECYFRRASALKRKLTQAGFVNVEVTDTKTWRGDGEGGRNWRWFAMATFDLPAETTAAEPPAGDVVEKSDFRKQAEAEAKRAVEDFMAGRPSPFDAPAPVEGQTFSEVDSPIEPQDARPLRPDEVEPAHWTPEEWQSLYKGVREYSKQLVQERDDLRRQLAEAQGALKPFGEAYQQRPDKVTVINVPGITWEAWAEAARLITAAALTASAAEPPADVEGRTFSEADSPIEPPAPAKPSDQRWLDSLYANYLNICREQNVHPMGYGFWLESYAIALETANEHSRRQLAEAQERIAQLEAALKPFARAADFFEHVHDYTYFEPDEGSLRNYSNTHTNQAINPLDGLKVRDFRRAAALTASTSAAPEEE